MSFEVIRPADLSALANPHLSSTMRLFAGRPPCIEILIVCWQRPSFSSLLLSFLFSISVSHLIQFGPWKKQIFTHTPVSLQETAFLEGALPSDLPLPCLAMDFSPDEVRYQRHRDCRGERSFALKICQKPPRAFRPQRQVPLSRITQFPHKSSSRPLSGPQTLLES